MDIKYEAIFIIKDDEDEVKNAIEDINNIVIAEGAKVYKPETIGKKKMAYEVKGYREGYYYLIQFELDESKEKSVKKMSNKINTLENVLKHLIIKL